MLQMFPAVSQDLERIAPGLPVWFNLSVSEV